MWYVFQNPGQQQFLDVVALPLLTHFHTATLGYLPATRRLVADGGATLTAVEPRRQAEGAVAHLLPLGILDMHTDGLSCKYQKYAKTICFDTHLQACLYYRCSCSSMESVSCRHRNNR